MNKEIKLLIKKYGDIRPLRLTGGFTNSTYLLQGTAPPLVAKIANLSNQDIENERQALFFLKDSAITPKIVELISEEGTQIVISLFMRGQNGQSVLDTGDVHRSERLFRKMGLCLADDIHSHHYDGTRHNLRLGHLNRLPFPIDFVPEDLLMKCATILERLEPQTDEWVLTHGDFGSHNVLVENDSPLTVIDWEWAEWFHPVVDLAWVCWNTKLHYPEIADRLNRAFLEAYQSRKAIPVTPQTIKAYALYKLRNILMRMEYADQDTQEKWIHRLEWTLNSELI